MHLSHFTIKISVEILVKTQVSLNHFLISIMFTFSTHIAEIIKLRNQVKMLKRNNNALRLDQKMRASSLTSFHKSILGEENMPNISPWSSSNEFNGLNGYSSNKKSNFTIDFNDLTERSSVTSLSHISLGIQFNLFKSRLRDPKLFSKGKSENRFLLQECKSTLSFFSNYV